jgi:uncharacterized protein (DUF1778 family)
MAKKAIPEARDVIGQHDATVLSNRDRDIFLALLDDANPNKALSDAAERYKKHLGRTSGGKSVSREA